MKPFELTWEGVPLCETYGLRVAEFTETPPEPKTYYVDVPGGQNLDLTESLTGFTAFDDRSLSITFFYDGRWQEADWADVATDLKTLLHGERGEYELSWDEGYTYTGRAQVTSVEFVPRMSCNITVEITAEPWKVREVHTQSADAVGGVLMTCTSGRRPVHPLITCNYPVTVNWEGQEFVVPAGQTYRMASVVFTEGDNEIWLNVYSYRTATWEDVADQTWADVGGIRWANIVVADGEEDPEEFDGDGTVTLQWSEEYI